MYCKASSYTPEVNFDRETSVFEIKGRSFPENAKAFYVPILEYLSEFVPGAGSTITFRINLEYFNTASSKFLLEMLYKFEFFTSVEGVRVNVEWVYAQNDEDMKEAGEEFEQIVKIPFIFIEEN